MLNVIVLFAGKSDEFKKSGYDYPKNLVEIDGAPLVQRVLENLAPLRARGASFICMVRRDENRRYHTGDVIRLVAPDARIVEVNADTGGAACTALLGVDLIDPGSPLVVTNGDIILDTDLCHALDDFTRRELDGGAISFQGVHPRWSFMRMGPDELAMEVAEKRPISSTALTGFSYFKTGASFIAAASRMLVKDGHVGGVYYVAPVFNELILEQKRIGSITIPKEHYQTLKTPRDIAHYEARLTTGKPDSPAVDSIPPIKLYAIR